MKSPVKRRQEENNKKIQKADKAKRHPGKPGSPSLRNSPAARMLAELRKKAAKRDR